MHLALLGRGFSIVRHFLGTGILGIATFNTASLALNHLGVVFEPALHRATYSVCSGLENGAWSGCQANRRASWSLNKEQTFFP
jgi:hypothetical protein